MAALQTRPLKLRETVVGSLWAGAQGPRRPPAQLWQPLPIPANPLPANIQPSLNAIEAGLWFRQIWDAHRFFKLNAAGVEQNISNILMLSGFIDLNEGTFSLYFGVDNVIVRNLAGAFVNRDVFLQNLMPVAREVCIISMHATSNFYNNNNWTLTAANAQNMFPNAPVRQRKVALFIEQRQKWLAQLLQPNIVPAGNLPNILRKIKIFDLQPKIRAWNADGFGWHRDFRAPYIVDNTLHYIGGTCNIPARIRAEFPRVPEFNEQKSLYVNSPVGAPGQPNWQPWNDGNLQQMILFWLDYIIFHGTPIKPSNQCPSQNREFIYVGWSDLYTMGRLRALRTPHSRNLGQLYNYYYTAAERIPTNVLRNATAEAAITNHMAATYNINFPGWIAAENPPVSAQNPFLARGGARKKRHKRRRKRRRKTRRRRRRRRRRRKTKKH